MALPILPLIFGISTLASLIGKGVSSHKQRDYQEKADAQSEEQRKKTERQQLKSAMARRLGVETMPYQSSRLPAPAAPSTAWSDTMAGLGDVGANFASSQWAKKMFPSSR